MFISTEIHGSHFLCFGFRFAVLSQDYCVFAVLITPLEWGIMSNLRFDVYKQEKQNEVSGTVCISYPLLLDHQLPTILSKSYRNKKRKKLNLAFSMDKFTFITT